MILEALARQLSQRFQHEKQARVRLWPWGWGSHSIREP